MIQILFVIVLIVLTILLSRKMFPVGKNHLYESAKGPEKLSSHSTACKAVSIHSYKDRCSAAKQIAGQRFLSSEAPAIPLKSCTSEACHCVYMHHTDRRTGTDQRGIHEPEDEFLSTPGYVNRRMTQGRRASDTAFA
jgi:hypothetical protein